MKNKTIFGGALVLTCLVALASCGGNSEPTDTNSQSQSQGQEEVIKKELSLTLDGNKTEGEKLSLRVMDSEGAAVNDYKLEILAGSELIKISGNEITLNGAGKVKLSVSKEGFNTKTIEFDIAKKEVVLKKMVASYKGHAFKGETITLEVKENDALLTDYSINILKGADICVKNEDKLVLLDQGTIELEIVSEGYETLNYEIKVENVLTIAEIKANIDEYNGKMVTIRGEVSATLGNTFYVMNGKDGFLVYNIETSPMFGNPGDAFEFGKIAVGKKVLVTAVVENGKFGLQLSGFQDGGYAQGCQANLSNAEIKPIEVYEVRTEEDLKALIADPMLAGSRVRITGKFLSGDFSSLESPSPKSPIFKMMLGQTGYTLKFDKNGSESMVKKYWSAANVEQNDYLTVEANFTNFKEKEITLALCNEGTTVINETKNPKTLKVTADSNQVQVGSELTLSTTLVEGLDGKATFEIISGSEFAIVNGNKLSGTKPGLVTLIARIGNVESLPFEVNITEAAYQSVMEALNTQDGSSVNVKATVVAVTGSGFILGDETGYIYCYDSNAWEFPEIGKVLILKGNTETYERVNQKQIVDFTYTVTEEVSTLNVEYQKKEAKDMASIDVELFKKGMPIEIKVKVESASFNGDVTLSHPELDALIYSSATRADLGLNYTSAGKVITVKGFVMSKYEDYYDGAQYLMYLTEVNEAPLSPLESLTIEADKASIGLDGTTGAGRTYVSFTYAPFDSNVDAIELIAIEGTDLVTIEVDSFTGGYKVKSNGVAGTVMLQAICGGILSNVIKLTIA